MEPDQYLDMLASQLAQELTAHDTIRQFVGSHPTLIGAYAEASVIKFIKRVVAPLRVSTGTIIYEGNVGKKPPQLDTIIWSPTPVPAVFENGDFAIVPRGSAHGYLEIKSTDYSGTGSLITDRLNSENELIQPVVEGLSCAMGVICLAQHQPNKNIQRLIDDGRAAILLNMKNDRAIPNPSGVMALINFLACVNRRAAILNGRIHVTEPKALHKKIAKKK